MKEGEGELDRNKIVNEACFDKLNKEIDLEIGFDTKILQREELNINLIYYDEELTTSLDSYNYYKQFKVNVVGGFFAYDEIEFYKKFLEEIKQLNNKFIVVTKPNYIEKIFNISKDYSFNIQRIVLLSFQKNRFEKYLKTYASKVEKIAKDINELIEYLKEIGKNTSNFNPILRFFSKKRIFTLKDIEMDAQLSICPIITAYEYDQLYFLIHFAYAHFFKNEKKEKSPKNEEWPTFEEKYYNKIKDFIYMRANSKDSKDNDKLSEIFKKLKNSKNFTEDAIKEYASKGVFCNTINYILENFEKELVKLAYFIGPFLFGLNKYALEHPNKGLNQDTFLYRKILVSPLEKYNYTLSEKHIICFTSLTFAYAKETEINRREEDIEIDMKIKYRHKEGNITPALNIEGLSKNEGEMLIFPFTFCKINSIEKKENCDNCYIFNMELVNRKTFLEYDLLEGKKYNIDYLDDILSKRSENRNKDEPMFIENEDSIDSFDFKPKKSSRCLLI